MKTKTTPEQAPTTHELSASLQRAKVRDRLAFSYMFDHACELEESLTMAKAQAMRWQDECQRVIGTNDELWNVIRLVQSLVADWRETDWFHSDDIARNEIVVGVDQNKAREVLKKLWELRR